MNQANTQVERVALVTGAARRIGAAIAMHLHQSGFRLAIHCHHSQAEAHLLAKTMNQIRSNSAEVFPADLTVMTETVALLSKTIRWAGQLDLLVNNASVFIRTPENPLDEALWETLFTTNTKAPFWLSHAARPHLVETKGAIINITDIHAETPLKHYSIYCESKAALTLQTKALAQEFAPHIRVNAVAPGSIAWPEHENTLTQEQQHLIMKETLLKKHGEPLYIAQAVLALAENPFITGQILRVDGGRRLG